MKKAYNILDKLMPIQKDGLVLLIFATLISLIYGQTATFKYCIDDQYYLWLNIADGSSIWDYVQALRQRFWGQQYRPVTFLTILVEGLIFGEKPEIHHVFNLIYYLVLCFVIYKVLYRYLLRFEKKALLISITITVLFLVHTSHSNVVSSIKNRETILSLFFGITSLYFWMNYLDNRKIYWVFISAFTLLIGVYAKIDILTFILLIPLFSFIYDKEFKLKTILSPSLLFVLLTLFGIYIIGNFVAFESTEFVGYEYENPLFNVDLKFWGMVPYSLYILSIYEKFMVWPFEYYFYFGFDVVPVITSWKMKIVVVLLAHLLLLISCVYMYKRKLKQYLLGPLMFFISIAPFILVLTTGYFAVRYSFIASLGFCIAFTQLLFLLLDSLKSDRLRIAPAILLILMFFGLARLSYLRSFAWKDLDTLYSTDIPQISRSANANRMACTYYYLVAEESSANEMEELVLKSHKYCDQALEVYEIESVLDYKARGFKLTNKPQKAFALYKRIIELNNKHVGALDFLAYFYKNQGDYNKAISHFERLNDVAPNKIESYIELTQLYNNYKMFDEAISLNKKLHKAGHYYDALLNFGDVFIAKGDTLSALKNYDKAVILKPEDYIIKEALRISKEANNDTMIVKLNLLLRNK